MFSFSTSLSALQANQVAISTIANNIANANTPGYHRQQVSLADRAGIPYQNLLIGSGVDVDTILRSFNSIVEVSISENLSRFGDVNESLTVLSQVETILGPGQGSIHDRVEGFFNDLQSLTLEPDNQNLRSITVQKLDALTNEIHLVSTRLDTVERTIHRQIEHDVESVNNQLAELIDLNKQIRIAQNSGKNPNDLLDQFQQKLNNLADLIDITTVPSDQGGFAFQLAGGTFHFESSIVKLETTQNSDGEVVYRVEGSTTDLSLSGGKLAGLQRVLNSTLASVKDRLGTLTNEFAFQLDHVHSTGLSLNGPFDLLKGARSVSDINIPLSQATPFEQLQSGSLFVSVEDTATNIRRTHEVTIDPATESLSDIATKIDSIPNLQAIITNGTLTIASTPGTEFDFAGRLETVPDLTNYTGSAAPRLEGSYTGANNDEFRFEFFGSGTVGVSNNLRLRVTNLAGDLIGVFSIGQGYEPDSLLTTDEGVSIAIGPGTVNGGDFFTTPVVQESDETGVLVALGLNTLFDGSTPSDLSVRDQILSDPDGLALARSTRPGDAANLKRLVDLRELESLDGLNFELFVEKINLNVGQEVNLLSIERTNLEMVGQQLAQQVDAISGVDPNQEMVYLLQFQRSYEASVRVISTVDQMLSELFSIIR